MTMTSPREQFPRGLAQPETGYRFSMDALLLACFAELPARGRGLDLGAGCGVAGLGALLADPDSQATITGIDAQPEMTMAAFENAARLELAHRHKALTMDLANLPASPLVPPQSADFVLTNPPYRKPSQGRRPPDPGRDAARFEIGSGSGSGLDHFLAAAAHALKNKKPLFMVFLPQRLPELVTAMQNRRLQPKTLTLCHSRPDEPARIMLVKATKNGRPGLDVRPPLVLYQGTGTDSRLSHQALEFCPFLACNS